MEAATAKTCPAGIIPDWHKLGLNEGITVEPSLDAGRLVLWMANGSEGGYQYWERINGLPNTEFAVEPGITAASATRIRTRQERRGLLGKALHLFQRSGDPAWVLPNGKSAEQCGERQSDLLLVWSADETRTLDRSWIESHWPGKKHEQLGKNLYLVTGVEAPRPRKDTEEAQHCPQAVAERMLAEARAAADRSREASALADLGSIYLHEGHAEHAIKSLGDALAIARELGDRSRESDIIGNLGLVTLAAGHAGRAREIFEQELGLARQAGSQFSEKIALGHLGLAHARLNDPTGALAHFEQGLALARSVGHRQHQTELLWYMGIACAELGQRQQAIEHAQAAIDLMEKMRNPQAAWYAEHLRKYRAGESEGNLAGAPETGDSKSPAGLLGGTIVAGMWSPPTTQVPTSAEGPGLLRMAVSAARSMAKFVGSGFKMASPQTVQIRLRTCTACEHHTGLRCRLCGCFTSAKARMPHEECPIGKWPV
jgi:tetratricopeptide (TPR) repeat protein